MRQISVNGGLNNYRLEGLPRVPGSAEKRLETQLRKGKYAGVLADELYLEFLERARREEKKYGVIRWSDCYEGKTEKIMQENKTVKFGVETPEKIEKELDAIFA